MNKSETIGALAAALAKAQAEMKNPAFDKTNPHFKNKYASLAAVRDAVIPLFNKHGLSLVQTLTSGAEGVSCETTILHESGEWLADTLTLPVSKNDAQGYGSAVTYARRYSLMSFGGVVGDEDDDGNAAAKTKAEPKAESKAITPSTGVLEALSVDDQRQAKLVASLVISKWAKGDEAGAAKAWSEESPKVSTDMRVAAWALLDAPCRRRIKEIALSVAGGGADFERNQEGANA